MNPTSSPARTRLYRIGPDLADEHIALLHNGVALRYPDGNLTVGEFPRAAAQYFAVTGLPVEAPVTIEGKAFSIREAEIRERVHLLHGLVVPALLAGFIQHPGGTPLTLFADGGWRFGPLEEGTEQPAPILWQTQVRPELLQGLREAFLGQIRQESRERIDRIQQNLQRRRK